MKKTLAWIMLAGLLAVSGCAKADSHDVEQLLAEQKIVFIMSGSFYAESYVAGYFIDGNGKKHIYGLYDQHPFESIAKEYAYLLEHYDEFEVMDFLDDETMRECTEALYQVDPDAAVKEEGEVLFDYPGYILWGIKQVNGHEEMIELESDSGILTRLDDPYAAQIYEIFGDVWYSIK